MLDHVDVRLACREKALAIAALAKAIAHEMHSSNIPYITSCVDSVSDSALSIERMSRELRGMVAAIPTWFHQVNPMKCR